MNESKTRLSRDGQPLCPKRRRFSEEFKRDAVRLVAEEGYTFKAAAKAVGVSEKSLRDWHKRLAPAPRPCGELREENKRLRRQLKRAELERDILKKATVYFAKESL
jgi:transposase